jgi:TonB family protein
MEFHDYKKFGKVMVPRTLREDPEPGTTITSKVIVLEDLNSTDPTLFTVAEPTKREVQSLRISQDQFEAAAIGNPKLAWPQVQSGKTSGLLSMYVSVDREGNVREAYPLNSDNAGLQDAARDQLLKWKLKPVQSDGVPVQVESALSFKFETDLTPNSQKQYNNESLDTILSGAGSVKPLVGIPERVRVAQGVTQGFLIDKVAPIYPKDARKARVQGTVVMKAVIGKDGGIASLEVLSGPTPLVDAAVNAVKQWKYRPYLLQGQPVEVETQITVNFQLR